MKIAKKTILPIIRLALKEDIGPGDISSKLIIPKDKAMRAVIVAKEAQVVCGLDVVRLVFQATDKRIRFHTKTKDGKKVKRGQVLAYMEGEARNILKAERVALNFLGRLCGVATLTAQFVERVKPYPVQIMDTRKTTPGLRLLEKYAVCCGGGLNHRLDLGDQVLIKDNHLSVVPVKPLRGHGAGSHQSSVISLGDLIKGIKKKKPKRIKVEVEVKNLRELKEALNAGPDIIMLDNFNLKKIRQAVKIRNKLQALGCKLPKLEVSGGVHLNNVRRIAACGVERISIGALTHSAKAQDVSLNCEEI